MADDNKKGLGLEIGGGAIGQVIGTGLDLATSKYYDKQQLKQQAKLQELQMQGAKEMGIFNREQALQMWKDTNYGAQRQQMQEAGLNVGLMYGSAGQGGTTSGAGQGNVGAGTAAARSGQQGMGIQLGMQLALQKAQIENIEANTAKTKVDTTKTAGVDTDKVATEIKNLLQQTDNAKMQNAIMAYEKAIKDIELNKEGRTLEDQVLLVKEEARKLKAEATSAQTKGDIDVVTKDNVIKGVDLANQAVEAGITATKAGTKATEATTAQTEQNTRNLEQDEINKILSNAMKAAGVEPTDNMAVRMLQRWLGENDISMKSVTQKMSKIGAWLKGQAGEQTWEQLGKIMRE